VKRRLVAACGLLSLLSLVATATPRSVAADEGGPSWYVSLGDSLAQGVQPNAAGKSVITNQGYVDDLYAHYRAQDPSLQLAKLACPGETTTTMITGGIPFCQYPHQNQLAEAVAFLTTHRVSLVTIDIGGNNVDGCTTLDPTCITNGLNAIGHDLPIILTTLRQAAPHVRIVAMNYYDAFLAAWLQGPAGQALARASVDFLNSFNGVLATVFNAFHVPVADVSRSFSTSNFRVVEAVGLPLNVVRICSWTWMCAPSPVGPNIHANATGYAVIARTFERTIGDELFDD
jgi:lysophospholipase L1-like esterase